MPRLPKRTEELISRLVEQLASGDYTRIPAGTLGRVTLDGLKRAITEYGRTLVALPQEAFEVAEVYPIDGEPTESAVDMPLWTAEEGRSDLTLFLSVVDGADGPRISIDDIRVP